MGLHYLGGLAPGGSTRQVFDLVTGGAVALAPLPDRYDVIHAGAESYGVRGDLARMEAELALVTTLVDGAFRFARGA